MNLVCTPGKSTWRRYTPGRGWFRNQVTTWSNRSQSPANSRTFRRWFSTHGSTSGRISRVNPTRSSNVAASRCLPIRSRHSSMESIHSLAGISLAPRVLWLMDFHSMRYFPAPRVSRPIQSRTSPNRSLRSLDTGPLSLRRNGNRSSSRNKAPGSTPRVQSLFTWARISEGVVQLTRSSSAFLPGIPRWTGCGARNCVLLRCARIRPMKQRAR